MEGKIRQLVIMARIHFPTARPDIVAERMEKTSNLELQKNMPPEERERIRKKVRALIKKGVWCERLSSSLR
jgi:hypothetical protein